MKRRLDLICSEGHIRKDVIFDSELKPVCDCGSPMDSYWPGGEKFMVNGDDIPGGLEVKHGICWPDGTPRKFYSKSEIRKAANENGWTLADETPKLNSKYHEAKLKEAERKGRSWY